ncbi:MAG: response regulator [bacterium]|nr:response regulator [bacterium]
MAKILIVEDEQDTRVYLSTLLQDNGYETFEAVDGEEGLTKLGECNPDLIILDMIMPKESGIKFFRNVKTSDEYKNIPVIVNTGIGHFKELFDQGRKALPKPEAFIEKPNEPNFLLKTVKDLLS